MAVLNWPKCEWTEGGRLCESDALVKSFCRASHACSQSELFICHAHFAAASLQHPGLDVAQYFNITSPLFEGFLPHISTEIHEDLQALDLMYRRLSNESWAREFASGSIVLSTLQHCRTVEDEERQDKNEGRLIRNVTAFMDASNPEHKSQLEATGKFEFEPNATPVLEFYNSTIVEDVGDAYVLCFSEVENPGHRENQYGDHLIRITAPYTLFEVITKRLDQLFPLRKAVFGRVEYRSRNVKNFAPVKTRRDLIKPPEFSSDRELRMIWFPERHKIVPQFRLWCTEARDCCEILQ
jgi:hypothetical protein